MVRFILGGICFVIFVAGIGLCENPKRRAEVESNKTYEWQYNLGVEPRKSKPTRITKYNKSSRGSDYVTKEEFYEGLEDAEMKGKADDPSAQDIYDEFNR